LAAANIKNAVSIFGVEGTHAPLVGDNITGEQGALIIPIPAANYPAGKIATAQDNNLAAANIKNAVSIFGVEGTYIPAATREMIFGPKVLADDYWIYGGAYFSATGYYLVAGK
jgi:hypothetical protein